jgi:hypothetical protein
LAFLYRYDWFVTPFSEKDIAVSGESKLLKDFSKVLNFLDNSNIKKLLGNIALEVVKKGSYYGTILDLGDSFSIQ